MPLVNRSEDLQAWQEARRLTRQMYELCAAGPLARDFGLRDQLCRAAVSTMANCAEGFDCESRLEFARFLGFARRSAVEVQSLLYVALDNHYIDSAAFDDYYAQAAKTKALLGGLKHSLIRRHAAPGS